MSEAKRRRISRRNKEQHYNILVLEQDSTKWKRLDFTGKNETKL
jgi:hypothetical protein